MGDAIRARFLLDGVAFESEWEDDLDEKIWHSLDMLAWLRTNFPDRFVQVKYQGDGPLAKWSYVATYPTSSHYPNEDVNMKVEKRIVRMVMENRLKEEKAVEILGEKVFNKAKQEVFR